MPDDAWTILVGPERKSHARYSLRGPGEMRALLRVFGALGGGKPDLAFSGRTARRHGVTVTVSDWLVLRAPSLAMARSS